MITITIKNDSIEAIGHAEYDVHGKDIICAAVSILMMTLATRGQSRQSGGHMKILTSDKEALKLIAEGLKLVAYNSPRFVEVIEIE